jgi:hypothetical protein
MSETSFNLEYIISASLALLSAYLLNAVRPDTHALLKWLLVPLLIAYVMLTLMDWMLPGLNKTGSDIHTYLGNKTLGNINSTSYVEIFPPILALIVIFFVLLLNNNM